MTTSTWSPLSRVVTNITQANPGVVTTSVNHGYLNGLFVRFFFPNNVGMSQLNDNVFLITVLSSNTFSIDANTTNYDPFNNTDTTQTPQVIPVGELATTLANLEHNTLTPTSGI